MDNSFWAVMLYRGARRQKGPLFRTIKVARSEYSGEWRTVTEIVRKDTLLYRTLP